MRVDRLARCAALSLPHESVAILPLYQSQVELDALEQENGIRYVVGRSTPALSDSVTREVPYSQSFVLDFSQEVDVKIRNIADFVFLPAFNNVTLAILSQEQQTWTGSVYQFSSGKMFLIFFLRPPLCHLP